MRCDHRCGQRPGLAQTRWVKPWPRESGLSRCMQYETNKKLGGEEGEEEEEILGVGVGAGWACRLGIRWACSLLVLVLGACWCGVGVMVNVNVNGGAPKSPPA